MCVAWRTRCVLVCVCVWNEWNACVRVRVWNECEMRVCVCVCVSPGVRVGAHLDIVHHPLHHRHRTLERKELYGWSG